MLFLLGEGSLICPHTQSFAECVCVCVGAYVYLSSNQCTLRDFAYCQPLSRSNGMNATQNSEAIQYPTMPSIDGVLALEYFGRE